MILSREEAFQLAFGHLRRWAPSLSLCLCSNMEWRNAHAWQEQREGDTAVLACDCGARLTYPVNLRLVANCGTCAHRVETPDDANKDHECRRYPPTAAGFPGVGLGTWCGEHKPKGDA